MASFAPIVDVENVVGEARGHHLRRVAGLMEDDRTVAVAAMATGETSATIEFTFDLAEAHALALAALSGDRRAMTTPGLARKLSATVAILFRVCLATGGLQQEDGHDGGGGGHGGDRDAAADDECADD